VFVFGGGILKGTPPFFVL